MTTILGKSHVYKRLSDRERREPEAIARLRAEAELLARLNHTDVTPKLLARGEDAQGPWHQVERVPFPTLADRLERGALAVDFIERASRALFVALSILHEAADARGPLTIVHADLSPANLAVDDDGARAVILDLDLARWRDGSLDDDGSFRGTIHYAAPEVARGGRQSARSDLFSLGMVLLHAVTGHRPRDRDAPLGAQIVFAAEEPIQIVDRASFGGRGRGHTAILACLAHAPEDRPKSARHVLAML